MAELSLDALDIRDRAGIFLDVVSGLFEPADVRGTDTVVPGLEGRIERNRVKDVRRVRLEGYVTGSDAADMIANTQALMGACDPENIVDLVVDDAYYAGIGPVTLAVRFVNAIPGPPTYGVLYQSWSLEFESITPDWT